MTRDEVIDVLAVVAAATRRTVGETDVLVWSGVIGDLDKPSSMDAVTAHLREKPGVWLEPGHVRERVRAKRRAEIEEESDEARSARQELQAAKVAEDVAELAAGKGIPVEVKFHRPTGNHLTVRCPWCRADAGRNCVVPQTNDIPAGGVHPSRIEAAHG